jgi:spore germination protein YaaH/5-hydroxyisourate hydrolase-like protein (transthyretin family)
VRRALTALTACLALVVPLAVTATARADSPPPKRVASGWLPYWMTSPARPVGVNSAVQNAGLFTDVSPFWFSATAASPGVKVGFNPNFTNAAANAAWAMGQLKGAGLTVLPSIADGSGKGRMSATLADPAQRTAHVNDIVNLVMANGYDGIDLDYETFAFSDGSPSWATTQPNWTAFVNELSAALHAQGKLLSVTIPPPCTTTGVCGSQSGYWVYNIAGIAPAADRIRIMAYDYHVQGIGPIAPMPWVRGIVQYSVSVMDAAKLQIGVPTYGRAWTLKTSSGRYQLKGTCPASGTSAYRSLTASQSVSDADIPALLTAVGKTPADVQWSDADQENFLNYEKSVSWTDSSGASQTCTASRILWYVGPQGVASRTALVGEFGLSAAAYWTVGGEDPVQWPLIGGYAQSLAPASTDVTAAGVPNAVFGAPVAVGGTATSRGAPVAGVPASVQFRPAGQKKWQDIQAGTTGADGSIAFTVQPAGTGDWRIFVPGAPGRVDGASAAFTTQILAAVTATPTDIRVPREGQILVRTTALPAQAGQKVVLQIKRGDKWKNVARGVTNKHGREKLRVAAPASSGLYTYRVVAVAKGSILANASAEIPIRVIKRHA